MVTSSLQTNARQICPNFTSTLSFANVHAKYFSKLLYKMYCLLFPKFRNINFNFKNHKKVGTIHMYTIQPSVEKYFTTASDKSQHYCMFLQSIMEHSHSMSKYMYQSSTHDYKLHSEDKSEITVAI